MPKLITKREKTILFLTIFTIIFAVVFNFFLWPLLVKYDSLNKEIKISAARLKKYYRLLGQKEMIKNKYNAFSTTLRTSGGEKDTQIATLAALEEMALAASLRLIDIRPQKSVRETGLYKEIIIEIRTEGSMESHLRFIYALENSLLLLRIQKFELAAKTNAQALEGTFTIIQPAI
jgi:hypothetical protein